MTADLFDNVAPEPVPEDEPAFRVLKHERIGNRLRVGLVRNMQTGEHFYRVRGSLEYLETLNVEDALDLASFIRFTSELADGVAKRRVKGVDDNVDS